MHPRTHASTHHTIHTEPRDSDQFQLPPSTLPIGPIKSAPQIPNVIDGPQQNFQISLKLKTQSQTTSSAYLTDDSLIALGHQDGTVSIIATNNGNIEYTLKSTNKSPVSSISLNPDQKLRNTILLTHVDGTLQYWHSTSKQILFSKTYEQFLYCCEISPDGSKYIFAGDNGLLKLSNMNKEIPLEFQQGHFGSHSNRVFCVKWDKKDHNLFVSGGWDKSILFWDIRAKTSVNKLFGSFIGGKSLDIQDNYLLIGSNTNNMPIKLYDIKAGKMHSVDWHFYSESNLHSVTGVLNCSFALHSTKGFIAQTTRNQIRLYYQDKCICWQQKPEDIKGFSMCHATKKQQVLATWSNGDVQILSYN